MSVVDALKESSDEWREAFQKVTLTPPLAPSPPKTPTFFELAAESQEQPAKKSQGLYEQMLNARPEALYYHVLEHKEDYPETYPLLRELVGGKKFSTVTDTEQQLLDKATYDFATYTPPNKRLAHPPPVRKEESDPPPVVGMDVPEGTLRPYWWLI